MAAIVGHDAQTAARLAECVERDPARLGGEPVFRGTRVPVKSLFDHLRAGDSLETFVEDFPGVTREQARLVLDAAGLHLLAEVRHILQEVPPIDPIPIRPAGYFANCYNREEIRGQNRHAKASVLRGPADLE